MDFSKLNYTLANEDSSLERSLVSSGDQVACMAGSGARIISILAAQPGTISAFDTSEEQIFMCRLRIAALKQLNWHEYCSALGYPSELREKSSGLLSKISLPNDLRDFVDKHQQKNGESPPIYWGVWEKSTIRNAKLLRKLLGSDFVNDLCDGLELHEILRSPNNKLRYSLALNILGHARFLSLSLGAKTFPQLSHLEREANFYDRLLRTSFKVAKFQANFFLQMLFLGRISSIHAVPDEVSFSTYTLAKDSVMQTRINLHHADIRSFGFQVAPLDRVFLSDVFSYLTETEAMHTLKKFESQMNVDGSILLRFYRYKPRIILDGGHLQEDRCHDFANKELTGAYDFCILRRSFGFQTLPMEESRCIRF